MMSAENDKLSQHIPLLAVLMLGMFLSVLNQTLLNVAIPQLINEFNITPSTAEWLMTGYMLVNGILIPLSPFLIERLGTRKLFIGSMTIFTIGSLVCGVAPLFSVLLLGRLIQAVAAGVIMPLVMTIILHVFPPEVRGKGMGIFGLGIMFAPAIGPTLSGWIMEHYSWRLLFDGIVLLGALVTIFAYFTLKNIQQEHKTKLDIWGALLSTIGFGTLLYGFNKAGSDGWTNPVVLTMLMTGTLFIGIFVWQQLRSSKPLLNFRVFQYDMFLMTTLINMVVTVAMYSGMFLLPIYLQNLRGFTPLDAGILMLPGAIIMGIMSPISGALFDKIGPRWLAVTGMLITVITTWQFAHLTFETSYRTILWLYMVRSFGMALLMMPITTAGLNQLPAKMNAHGTAMSNTMRQIAGSMGISLFTSIFTMRTDFHFGKLAEQMDTTDPIFAQVFQSFTGTIASIMGISSEQAQQQAITFLYGQAQSQAAVSGISDAFYLATFVAIIGLILSFFIRDVRKDKQPHPKQEPQPTPKEKTVPEINSSAKAKEVVI